MKELEDFIPEYNEWKKNNKNFNIFDYLTIKCSIEQVLVTSSLFYPELVFFEGCAFLKNSRQLEYLNSFLENSVSKEETERYINCFFLENYFMPKSQQEKTMLFKIAELLKDNLEVLFKAKYSDYQFEFELFEDEYDGICLTFYQKNNSEIIDDKQNFITYFKEKCNLSVD